MPPSADDPRPILVAVGSDASALRLVHAGYRVAKEQSRPWVAVHVHVADWESRKEAEQARFWLKEAGELGAATDWIKAPTLPGGLLDAARQWQPGVLLLGHGRPQGIFGGLERTRTLDLLKSSLDCQVVVLSLDSREPAKPLFRSIPDLLGLVAALLVFMGMMTLLATALVPALGSHGVQMVFGITLAIFAHQWGKRVSIPATVAAVVIYEAMFRAPGPPFGARDWPGLAGFVLVLVLAQLFMGLLDRLRQEARAVQRMEAETALLMLLGRALVRCRTREDVAEVLAERSGGLINARASLLSPVKDGWERLPRCGDDPPVVPQRSASKGLPDEDPLEPVFLDGASFLSLGGVEGYIHLRREDGSAFSPDEWGLLQAFAGLGTVAMERIRWHEAAEREKVKNETERMRNTLLGAVSHDLRTPLAAIQGAATSLLLPAQDMPEAERKDLLVMIREESERLARFLGDLLELTRLQSGAVEVQKEWQPLDEVVGAVIVRMERNHGPLSITVELPEDMPLAHLDGLLMEQVLLNLLGNARRHAPGSEVLLSAWPGQGSTELAVSDRGPGIPEEFRQNVFQKFFQLRGLTRDGGVGLGLAISEAIVKAHGGRIWVEEPPGGGACFRITLPLDGQPPPLPELEKESILPEPLR